MPIPKPIITSINHRATSAVWVDRKLLSLKNGIGIFGSDSCSLEGKILLTLAGVQAFIEEGTPTESIWVKSAIDWLNSNIDKCVSDELDPSLIRTNIQILSGIDSISSEDIESVKELIRNIVNKNLCDGNTAFLLACECIAECNTDLSDIISEIQSGLDIILENRSTSISDLAYCVQILLMYGLFTDKVDKLLQIISDKYNGSSKLWEDCIISTAYTIIDLSYVQKHHNLSNDLIGKINNSINVLVNIVRDRKKINSFIKNAPIDIGDDLTDKYVYAISICLRAIVCGSVFSDSPDKFAVHFAHGFLKVVEEEQERNISEKITEINNLKLEITTIRSTAKQSKHLLKLSNIALIVLFVILLVTHFSDDLSSLFDNPQKAKEVWNIFGSTVAILTGISTLFTYLYGKYSNGKN